MAIGKECVVGSWVVRHCGHPTALWPWFLDGSAGICVMPGGVGFQTKALAVAAAQLVTSGRLEVVPRVVLAGRTKKAGVRFALGQFMVMLPGHGHKLEGRPVVETMEVLRRHIERGQLAGK